VLPLVIFIVFVLVVLVASRPRRNSRVQLRSCCGVRAWPPDDLTQR
jgi:hypothetical protein